MSNFKYLNTDFNEIFANKTEDFSCNQIVNPYTTDKNNTKYNATNGSTTQQNDIKYSYYNKDNISTNFSSGIQAFYIEYLYNSSKTTQSTIIPDFCKKIRYFLVGAGGSGGAGGGDNEGKKGTDGAGGGGGGYAYGEISVTKGQYIYITIGKGGTSVSGGQTTGDSNNGKVGISGGNTILSYSIFNYNGKGGGGGDGGHPSSSATAGIGGVIFESTTTTTTVDEVIISGSTSISNGSNSSGMTGGSSGYSKFKSGTSFITYFKPYSTTNYGNGGNGTSGGYDPNSSLTGVGIDGYARIYFMA
jgi:hypothetical protein